MTYAISCGPLVEIAASLLVMASVCGGQLKPRLGCFFGQHADHDCVALSLCYYHDYYYYYYRHYYYYYHHHHHRHHHYYYYYHFTHPFIIIIIIIGYRGVSDHAEIRRRHLLRGSTRAPGKRRSQDGYEARTATT